MYVYAFFCEKQRDQKTKKIFVAINEPLTYPLLQFLTS